VKAIHQINLNCWKSATRKIAHFQQSANVCPNGQAALAAFERNPQSTPIGPGDARLTGFGNNFLTMTV